MTEFKPDTAVDVTIDGDPARGIEQRTVKGAKILYVHHQTDKRGQYMRGVEKVLYRIKPKEGREFFARESQLKAAGAAQ